MQAIAVVGASGSGKSTLARTLAEHVGSIYIELDSIFHQADWQQLPTDQFRARVIGLTESGRWVSDGNYRPVRDILLERADTVVWLDYPRWLTTWRVTRRTIRRAIRREELWNGNRENWRNMFRPDPAENVILYSFLSHKRVRATFESALSNPTNNTTVHRFQSPKQTAAFVKQLTGSA